jgi:hypothetical protein
MSVTRAVVDRMEGAMAVILVGDDEYRLVVPKNLLPEDAVEGSVLKILVEVDSAATEDAKRRVQGLIDRLSGGEG